MLSNKPLVFSREPRQRYWPYANNWESRSLKARGHLDTLRKRSAVNRTGAVILQDHDTLVASRAALVSDRWLDSNRICRSLERSSARYCSIFRRLSLSSASRAPFWRSPKAGRDCRSRSSSTILFERRDARGASKRVPSCFKASISSIGSCCSTNRPYTSSLRFANSAVAGPLSLALSRQVFHEQLGFGAAPEGLANCLDHSI